jgi:hypothetical protein
MNGVVRGAYEAEQICPSGISANYGSGAGGCPRVAK